MRITTLSVSNFLSFAPIPNDFRVDFSSENLTVLVGPNGAGKSNVFRAIKVILDSLLWDPTSYHSVDVQNLFFRGTGRFKDLKIVMGISMNTPFEKELMTGFIKSALVNPEGQLFQGVAMPDRSASTGINMDADHSVRYARLIENAFDTAGLDGLLEGTIEVRVYSSEPYVRHVRFLSKRSGLVVSLLPNGGEITVSNVIRPLKVMSLADAWIESFSNDAKVQLRKFLTGESNEAPVALPKFNTEVLRDILAHAAAMATAKIGNVHTPIEKNVEHLYSLLGGWTNSNQELTLAQIFRFIISHGIVLFDQWFPLNSSRIESDYHPIRSLNDGDLALHLFHLKNGSHDDRTVFASIQKTYRGVTGTGLDVVMRAKSQQNESGQNESFMAAEIVVDNDIPLQYAGSGRAQVALLVSAMHLPHGVLLLDEPDTFLHPSIQANLMNSWKNGSAQSIIITHSPYMVPVGGLEHVRRISSKRESGWSVVSRKFSRERIRRLGIRRQIKRADESMFLFAKCVVFVEGYDEQVALPIWFDKWLKARGQLSSEALGVRFHAAFGKTGIMPLARVAQAYGIEWLALFDADIMSSNSDNRNDNKKIIQQFIDAKQVGDGELELGSEGSIKKFPIGQDKRIFVRGVRLNDNWETMDIYLKYKKHLASQIGMGPMISRYMAEDVEPPVEFDEIFERICELVSEKLVMRRNVGS